MSKELRKYAGELFRSETSRWELCMMIAELEKELDGVRMELEDALPPNMGGH